MSDLPPKKQKPPRRAGGKLWGFREIVTQRCPDCDAEWAPTCGNKDCPSHRS